MINFTDNYLLKNRKIQNLSKKMTVLLNQIYTEMIGIFLKYFF